jgi:ABC-type antimicrobial peptide transport system permease subunit
VAIQFLLEGIVVGIVAWMLAIPLSLGIRAGLLAGLPFGDTFDIPYPPLTLVIGLGGMLFLVVVASLWPAFAASRKTVSEILRYQ